MSGDGIELSIKKEISVRAKTLKINVKVTDSFCGELLDDNGEILREFEDTYVPNWVPGEYGDYLNLEIDIGTGVIKNWNVPSREDLEASINEE